MEGGIIPAAGKKGAKEKCGFETTSEEKDVELEELCQCVWKCARELYLEDPKKPGPRNRDAGTESAA